PSSIVAPEGLLRFTTNVSELSTSASSVTGTEIVLLVSPGANVSVPLVAVTLLPDIALPPLVAYATVTVFELDHDRLTIKSAVPIPSVVNASAMLIYALSLHDALPICPSSIVAPEGLLRFTTNVSELSTSASSVTATEIVLLVSPGA